MFERTKPSQKAEIQCTPLEHRVKDTQKLSSRSDLFWLSYSLRTASETSKTDFPPTQGCKGLSHLLLCMLLLMQAKDPATILTVKKTAKILYGPKEKVGFQVFVYFRFFMKPELVHQSLFQSWQKVNAWQKVVRKNSFICIQNIFIFQNKNPNKLKMQPLRTARQQFLSLEKIWEASCESEMQ